jgi:hypothetical protein
MALDPRIPLGVQPVQQQPNMLAQYAQIMGIKAAQQEMEGSEDVRRYFSAPADQRGDISQIMHTKGGRAASETLSQNAQRELKMELDALGAAKANVYMAKDPAALAEYMKGVYSSPAGKLLSRFVPVNKALAAIPTDPVAFKEYQKNFGLTADQIVTNVTKERGQNMTYGATVRGQDLLNAREIEKREYERANPTLSQVQGENGFYLYNPRDPNSAVPLGMRPPVAAPVAQPSAVNNLMMTTQPTPSINALTQPAPNQAGPTVAAANALVNQPTIIRPKQTIRQPVAVIKDGQVTLVTPDQAVGMTPATPGAEKILEKQNIAKEGKESVNRVLGNLYSEYTNLVNSGGITDTRRSVEENISARTGASAVGQMTGSFTGSEAQSFRDSIAQTRPLLLTAIMKATGLSATQLNSNVELQTYLKTATDDKVSIQANVKALNNISQMFGLGEKFEVPEIPKATAKTANPADVPPTGLSPEIAGLWKYMTPEDRKLWQK